MLGGGGPFSVPVILRSGYDSEKPTLGERSGGGRDGGKQTSKVQLPWRLNAPNPYHKAKRGHPSRSFIHLHSVSITEHSLYARIMLSPWEHRQEQAKPTVGLLLLVV